MSLNVTNSPRPTATPKLELPVTPAATNLVTTTAPKADTSKAQPQVARDTFELASARTTSTSAANALPDANLIAGRLRNLAGQTRNVVVNGLQRALGVTRQFADDTADAFIRGLQTNHSDIRNDGKLVGVGGKTYEPGTPLANMFGVAPQGGVRNNQTVIYTNGILNDVGVQAEGMQKIANLTGSRVVGVHNATQGPLADVVQSAGDKININDNLAAQTLSRTVLNELYAGRNVHLVGHSQGALVTSRALFDVRNHFKGRGWSEDKINQTMGRINVETYGGAARFYPDGPKYKHYVNTRDVVPVAVGLGTQEMQNKGLSYPGRGAQVIRFNSGDNNPMKAHDLGSTYLNRRQ
jgi:hypothetical protein